MKAFFRALAAAFKQAAPAQAIAGVMLLVLSLYTGYQIPRPSMIGALRWISYINVGSSICSPCNYSNFLTLANPLCIRQSHDQRVPHLGWDLFHTRAIWARICRGLTEQPSVYRRWVTARPEHSGRKCLCCPLIQLLLHELVEGKLIRLHSGLIAILILI